MHLSDQSLTAGGFRPYTFVFYIKFIVNFIVDPIETFFNVVENLSFDMVVFRLFFNGGQKTGCQLEPLDKQILQIAAVIGADLPIGLLRAIDGLSDEQRQECLLRLQAGEFLYERRTAPERVFAFNDLTLVPTLGESGDDKGRNRVLVYAVEEPAGLYGAGGKFWVACVEARYLGETYKDPPSGIIGGIDAGHFVPLTEFVPSKHCVGR